MATRSRRAASSAKAASGVTSQGSGETASEQPSSSDSATSLTSTPELLVDQMIQGASLTTTTTKSGWCLRQGLLHVITVDGGRLQPLVSSQGPPSFYHSLKSCRHEPTDNIKAPKNCFQSLCRIIAGQQLAGKAAQSIWKRLLETTQHNLTPSTVLKLAEEDLQQALQKPAGLSRAKANSIVDLARHFTDVDQLVSEEFLTHAERTEAEIRQVLLQVKGLGPWSCDMFILFYLEKPNVFPFGDLGVRKGVAKVFKWKNGKGAKGSLCQKKDLEKALSLVKPYQPYQSLFTYYMWRAADTQDVYGPDDEKKKKEKDNVKEEVVVTTTPVASSPPKRSARKRKARSVTP